MQRELKKIFLLKIKKKLEVNLKGKPEIMR